MWKSEVYYILHFFVLLDLIHSIGTRFLYAVFDAVLCQIQPLSFIAHWYNKLTSVFILAGILQGDNRGLAGG